MSILVNTGPTILTKTWYVDGDPTDIGTVTIGIDDVAGNEIVPSSTAVTDNNDGTYEYALAVQTQVNELIVTWTSGSQSLADRLEIVGGWLFTEAAARAFDAAEFASTTTYTDAAIAAERQRITSLLEQATGVSWVPRYGTHTVSGDGASTLDVPDLYVDSVLSATISDTSMTTSDVTVTGVASNRLHLASGWSMSSTPGNVTVTYDYGKRHIVDGVDRIGLIMLRDRLAPSNVPFRVWRMSNEMGTTDYTQPGKNRPFGIPEVDAWILAHDMRLPIG